MDDEPDFIAQLLAIKTVTPGAVKDLLLNLTASPSPSSFWLLSRMIRLASFDDLSRFQSSISELLEKYQHSSLAAAFAAGHFARRMKEFSFKPNWIPSNPYVAVQFMTLSGSEPFLINTTHILRLLDFPNSRVQKSAASVLVHSMENDRSRLAESALAAFVESPAVAPLSIPFPLLN
jgi:hypothetical protein